LPESTRLTEDTHPRDGELVIVRGSLPAARRSTRVRARQQTIPLSRSTCESTRVLQDRSLLEPTGAGADSSASQRLSGQIGKLDAEISSGGGSGRRGVSPTPLNSINVSLSLVPLP
jgi:hypothetical protein